jgi:hypothetical protein
MSKLNCSINVNIKREFPLIKGVDENVEFNLRNSKFCIWHGGRSDVNQPRETKKKKKPP